MAKLLLLLLLSLNFHSDVFCQTIAVFTRSRVPEVPENILYSMTERISSGLGQQGFHTIQPDLFLKSVESVLGKAQEQNNQTLSSSSLIPLCRNLNADYLFFITIDSLSHEVTQNSTYNEYYIDPKLSMTYHIFSVYEEKSILSGSVISENRRFTEQKKNNFNYPNYFQVIFTDLTKEILGNKKIDEVSKQPIRKNNNTIEFSVVGYIRELTLPVIVTDDKGKAQVTSQVIPLYRNVFQVSLDGLIIGSAEKTLRAIPGIHTLTISGEGVKPWKKEVQIRGGEKFEVELNITDEERKKLMEIVAFFETIKIYKTLADKELIQAQAELEKLKIYGYFVNQISNNPMANTENAPETLNQTSDNEKVIKIRL